MIVCPKCGNKAEDDAVFCDQCGTRLQPEAAAPAAPAPAPAPTPAAVICPSCGASNVPGEAFCENCGTKLAAPEPAAVPVAAPAAPTPAPAAAPVAAGAVVCPACGATAAPDDTFCYVCGADLRAKAPAPAEAAAAPAAAPAVAVPAVPTPAPNTCPSCGAEYKPGADFCEYCGAALTAAAPAPAVVEQAAVPVTPVPAPAPLVGARLIVAVSGIEIPLPAKAEILIGREDPVSSIFPDIDLTPHGGDEGGVSRRHAKITVQGSQYTVEDLNSTNGTFVNRQRLDPGAKRALSDGDEIRAGRVRLVFKAS